MNRRLLSIMLTIIMLSGIFIVSFPSYAAAGDPQNQSWYRFEETVSGTTEITDGTGLDLDGANQIKDESGLRNGNTLDSSAADAGVGTYETFDTDNNGNAVLPVPAKNIPLITDNKSFIKLTYGAKGQGIDAGEFKIGEGITIEGWIYPTGDPGNSWAGQRIFTLQPSGGFGPGCLWTQLNGTGFCFGVHGDNGSYKQFYSAPNMVKYNEWNYIAITWRRGENQVDFYSKSLNDTALNHFTNNEFTEIGSVPDIFPDPNAHASFGYAYLFGMDLGFDGYMDEMSVSNFKKQEPELLVVPDTTNSTYFYRFEKTASNITPVSDDALLSLDDPNGVRDEGSKRNAAAISAAGEAVGTYQNSDVSNSGITVAPPPAAQMKGVSEDKFFIKLDAAKKQGIDLGDIKVKDGLTLEGWVYPTGDKADWANNRFITKRTGWGNGVIWTGINSDETIYLQVCGPDGYKSWWGSKAKVKFNKWNYIAITWDKNSNVVDYYVKPIDNVMTHESITSETNIGDFSTDATYEQTTIGYNPAFDGGFNGYVDEVRISDYARPAEELLINDQVAKTGNAYDYYRFEATASGNTTVSDGALLDLDGAKQIKDEAGSTAGDAFSGNESGLGEYKSADAGVSAVPVEEMNGIAGNNYFAKLDCTDKKQGIDLGGTLGVGHGFTFEGWFCPTGDIINAEKNGLLIAKRSIAEKGNLWAYLNSEGGVTFKMTGDNYETTSAVREWKTDPGKVQWGKWNYIAIAVNRDRVDMDLYIKPVGGEMFHQTVRSITSIGLFPDTLDQMTIGYNPSLDAGFDGYVDEVRLTNYKLVNEELLAAQTADMHKTEGNFAVKLDENPSTNIPTFGSWNRHIVEIKGVYYASYLDNGEYGHIVKSTDGGHTWTDLYATGQMYFSAPPVLVSDKSGSLYAIGNGGEGVQLIFMKFSDNGGGMQLDIAPKALPTRFTTKFAAIYGAKDDVIYVSGRVSDTSGYEAPVHVFMLDLSGNILKDTRVIDSVGDWSREGGDDYWDSQYQSIYCDDSGRLHMLYDVYNWPYALSNEWIYTLSHVMYMYSDDGGESWYKADGASIKTPFAVNDLENGGTMISKDGVEGWRAWGSSILVKDNSIHILYHVYDNNHMDIYQRYVRLNRTTGAEEKRYAVTPYLEDMHSTLVSDPETDNIYISSEVERRPSVLVSEDNGDTWTVLAHALRPPDNEDYYSNTACQTLTSDGSIIALVSDWGYTGKREVVFSKINVRPELPPSGTSYYRFERTAADKTPVTNLSALMLDGVRQIRDESGLRNGDPYSGNGSDVGVYSNLDNKVTSVPVQNIAGTASNNFFAKLDSSSLKQGIGIGKFKLDTGLTLEGWFNPSKAERNSFKNGLMVSKGSAGKAGSFWLCMNPERGVTFGVSGPSGDKEWSSSKNIVDWGKWNYVAATWNKDSDEVDFYIVSVDGQLIHDTATNALNTGIFENSLEKAYIGYSSGFDSGFDGYADEVRLSDYKRSLPELLVQNYKKSR